MSQYSAEIILDSVCQGTRLTTMTVTMPRSILAEFNTHRIFSRNSASSRAIPATVFCSAVLSDPFVPPWVSSLPGMRGGGDLSDEAKAEADRLWREWGEVGVGYLRRLVALGVHKQHPNRGIEAWLWHKVIVSSTDWSNFFELRDHEDAAPEMQAVAKAMRAAYEASQPRERDIHIPYYQDNIGRDLNPRSVLGASTVWRLMFASAGKIARVSYGKHEEDYLDVANEELGRRMARTTPLHASPFEHVAVWRHLDAPFMRGASDLKGTNFDEPWLQMRRLVEGSLR